MWKYCRPKGCRSAPEHVLERLDQYQEEYELGADDEFWLMLDTDHWTGPGHVKTSPAFVRKLPRSVGNWLTATRVLRFGCFFMCQISVTRNLEIAARYANISKAGRTQKYKRNFILVLP